MARRRRQTGPTGSLRAEFGARTLHRAAAAAALRILAFLALAVLGTTFLMQ